MMVCKISGNPRVKVQCIFPFLLLWSNEGGWKFLLGPERPGGGRRCPFAPKLTRPGTLAPKVASVLMIIVICMQGANIIGMHLWKIIKARQNPTKYCL